MSLSIDDVASGSSLPSWATREGQVVGFAVSTNAGGMRAYLDATSNGEAIPGDLNSDGFVGGDDLDIVRSFWGQNVTPGDLLSGDPSEDGFVGGDDLDVVRAHWGQGTPPAPSAVPEPNTFILIMASVLVFGSCSILKLFLFPKER